MTLDSMGEGTWFVFGFHCSHDTNVSLVQSYKLKLHSPSHLKDIPPGLQTQGHIHYYINDDNNKDAIAAGYASADDAIPINSGMNCKREHKQESRERGLERNIKPNDMAYVAVATATSLVASHCLEIVEYMGAEHEQIATAVDLAINAKTNGDIMTLTAGAATSLRGAATLNARLKRGIGAITIPPIEDKCGEAKKASILTALDFVFQGGVLLKRTKKMYTKMHRFMEISDLNKSNMQILLAILATTGKDLKDSRVLTDVGDVPIQEIRDCGLDDKRLMSVIGESVKLVMEEAPLRPLVLGGDHSISFPVIRAVSEKLGGPVDVLHIDAHPDNYDAFEGNIYSHASSFARVMEGDYVRRLLQVGIRSITAEGRAQAKVKYHKETSIDSTISYLGFKIKDKEIQGRKKGPRLKLGEGVKGVYISIDVDCLDPAFAPGVSHIDPGGLSFRDVLNILHNLQGDVVAGDVVELNPQRDTVDGMTAMVAAKLVREMAAKIAK
ncbi:unnamed protein product [Vicia faba]|uniref:arginase n=1 Tax=Vicia faba TaxID=3906 RepID=A0AAV0Z0P4_VICFA|nr:unnamed protein product [Vicia faba]